MTRGQRRVDREGGVVDYVSRSSRVLPHHRGSWRHRVRLFAECALFELEMNAILVGSAPARILARPRRRVEIFLGRREAGGRTKDSIAAAILRFAVNLVFKRGTFRPADVARGWNADPRSSATSVSAATPHGSSLGRDWNESETDRRRFTPGRLTDTVTSWASASRNPTGTTTWSSPCSTVAIASHLEGAKRGKQHSESTTLTGPTPRGRVGTENGWERRPAGSHWRLPAEDTACHNDVKALFGESVEERTRFTPHGSNRWLEEI